MDTYKALVEMGFSKKRAASALRQANNDVNNALQVRDVKQKYQLVFLKSNVFYLCNNLLLSGSSRSSRNAGSCW